ncbi:hypothetical protein RJ640_009351 [Escallonia rubra]|uniref:C2 domain-containing protein n=1 Tax=Escallonia rubra TaxID=112253 RepID=A0AA88R912_9ASTE|nr:hypothetical protein RJ640_009351 [Escallonia rubra]
MFAEFNTHQLPYFAGQGSTPVWDEKFTFRVEYPGADNQYKLVLKIMDHDTFSTDDYLGQATIYLEDFLALGVENGTAELHPRKYRVVGSNQAYNGEIQVGITFTPKVFCVLYKKRLLQKPLEDGRKATTTKFLYHLDL